jgi:probable phosphoglycerate mutase
MTDPKGQVLAELSGFLGSKTNNVAEYSGLLACLEWALNEGHPYLRVVSDSELMVKQIQGKYKVKSPDLRPLFDEAKRRIALLRRFEISHALRHKNKDADRLANEAMDRGMGKRPAAAPVSGSPAATGATGSTGSTGSTVLRGFTREGAIYLLGGAALPDGVFVKIIPE